MKASEAKAISKHAIEELDSRASEILSQWMKSNYTEIRKSANLGATKCLLQHDKTAKFSGRLRTMIIKFLSEDGYIISTKESPDYPSKIYWINWD
jgi:hypothetical protein